MIARTSRGVGRGSRGSRGSALGGASEPVAILTSLSHSVVYLGGGDTVTITGTGMAGANQVLVGATEGTITNNTDTSITFTTPVKVAGAYNLTVVTAGGSSNALPLECWDPSILSCTTLHQASFTGAPWVGKASAGTSLDRDLVIGTTPAVGAAVNGYTPADFDGTNDNLDYQETLTTIFGGSSYSGVAFIKARTISTDSGAAGSNEFLLGNGSNVGVFLRSSGLVCAAHTDTTTNTRVATAPYTVNTWKCVHWKVDLASVGSELKIGTGGTWGTGVACTGVWTALNSNVISLGSQSDDQQYFDGLVLEVGIMAGSAISDANLTKWRSCASCRYGISF